MSGFVQNPKVYNNKNIKKMQFKIGIKIPNTFKFDMFWNIKYEKPAISIAQMGTFLEEASSVNFFSLAFIFVYFMIRWDGGEGWMFFLSRRTFSKKSG